MCKGLVMLAVALFALVTAGVTPQDLIATRQDAMDMSSITLRSMVDAMKSGHEPKTQAYPAAALAKWARALPNMFPSGTGEGETPVNTQARRTIWQDRAGFDKAAADYADATTRLTVLAAQNDIAAFTKQLDEVQGACNSCHLRYKSGAQGPPSK